MKSLVLGYRCLLSKVRHWTEQEDHQGHPNPIRPYFVCSRSSSLRDQEVWRTCSPRQIPKVLPLNTSVSNSIEMKALAFIVFFGLLSPSVGLECWVSWLIFKLILTNNNLIIRQSLLIFLLDFYEIFHYKIENKEFIEKFLRLRSSYTVQNYSHFGEFLTVRENLARSYKFENCCCWGGDLCKIHKLNELNCQNTIHNIIEISSNIDSINSKWFNWLN